MTSRMKSKLVIALAAMGLCSMLTGCVVAPDPYYGSGREYAPPLPDVVELYGRPTYYHHGYHYLYDNDRWYYNRNTQDHWKQLPRSHWPKDTRYNRATPRQENWNRNQNRNQDWNKNRYKDRDGDRERNRDDHIRHDRW